MSRLVNSEFWRECVFPSVRVPNDSTSELSKISLVMAAIIHVELFPNL
jgi:hypothetical protein